MKISKFTQIAATAAVMAMSATVASAIDKVDLVSIDTGTPRSFSAFGGGTGAGGTFNDTFTFTFGAGTASSGYSVSTLNFNLGPGFNFNSLITGMSLWNTNGSGTATTLTGNDSWVADATSVLGSNNLAFGNVSTLPGTYYLKVSGKVGAAADGYFYSGSISSSTVSPVPEPETYAMLLAGLGLMGAIARRRNKA
jgi:hypothetical protein